MVNGRSRLTPQHVNWNRDLPLTGEPAPGVLPNLHLAANEVTPSFLELGRSHTLFRGPMLLLCIVLVGLCAFALMQLGSTDLTRRELTVHPGGFMTETRVRDDGAVVWTGVMMLMVSVAALGFAAMARFDLAPPRDLPVRFNRRNAKVVFNSYSMNLNPFRKWVHEIKVWDWSAVHAEVVRTAGFTGKVYQVRYTMVLSHCRPGTTEVIDREVLAGPLMTDHEFDEMWSYVCRFMADGPSALPEQPLRDQGVYFWRSLFEYAEWIAPTRWGRAARAEISGGERAFLAILSPLLLALLPLFLAMGVCHYVAMRLARPASWPPEADAVSRQR